MNTEIFDALLAQVAQDEGGAKFSNWELIARKAIEEIERLQTLRDWRTPRYSVAQLQQFEESCIKPPSQFIPWHFLPEVPEIPTEPPYRVEVWAHISGSDADYCKPVLFSETLGFYVFENGRAYSVDVRAWHYLEEKAPPKPEGKVEPLVLGEPDPQKCKHIGHNWKAVYQCRGCGEIVPEEMAQKVDDRLD